MGHTYKKIANSDLNDLINNPEIKLDYDFVLQLVRKLMGYTYKKVSLDELRTFTINQQLVLDHAALSEYAKNVYGNRAYKIKTGVEWEYNDEGGTDPHLYSLTVYDAEDNELTAFPEGLDINYEYFRPCANYDIKYNKMSLEDAVNKHVISMREYDESEDGNIHTEHYELNLPQVEGTWLVNEVPDTNTEFYIKIVDPESD